MSRTRRRATWIALGALALPLAVAAPWIAVRMGTAEATHRDTADFEHADAAIVLGARVYKDGRPSRFLRERIEVGVALYKAGVVDRLIMSGDGNDSSGHGETAVMRRVAEELGVPFDVVEEDPWGLDTYSSCHRAQAEFGVSSAIVVSQEFHVPRAVWVCEQLGLEVQGAYPAPRWTKSTVTGHVREVAAVAKSVLDVWRGREPAS